MQITKYWIIEFSTPLDSYKKFYTALSLKKIPLLKADYNNGFFEVNSVYAPMVNSVSTTTKIPIQLVSTRTVTETKPTPKPIPKPIVSPITPIIQPAKPDYPPPPTDKPSEDSIYGKLVVAGFALVAIFAMGGKKKRGRK